MSKEYCPLCVEPLTNDSKKLGKYSVWLVCKKCGFRKRPENWWNEKEAQDQFKEYKDRTNSNNSSADKDW